MWLRGEARAIAQQRLGVQIMRRVFALLFVLVFPATLNAQGVEPRIDSEARGPSPQAGRFRSGPSVISPELFALPIEKDERATLGPKPAVGPPQIGFSRKREVDLLVRKNASAIRWRPIDGGHAVVFAVSSPGAQALRVAMQFDRIPEGLTLAAGSKESWEQAGEVIVFDSAWISSTYGNSGVVLWTPMTQGEQQIIEVWVPGSREPRRTWHSRERCVTYL